MRFYLKLDIFILTERKVAEMLIGFNLKIIKL